MNMQIYCMENITFHNVGGTVPPAYFGPKGRGQKKLWGGRVHAILPARYPHGLR